MPRASAPTVLSVQTWALNTKGVRHKGGPFCYNRTMVTRAFDKTDARLLELLQREFPLVARPFEAMGARLGISGDEVMERVSRLKHDGVIRQISAIFDSAALGYSGELVALKTDPDALDSVAAAVSAHKGVSHCYSRDAEYNLWFTITLGPEVDLAQEVETLSKTPGVLSFLRLPAIRVFKIGVFLDVTGDNASRSEKPTQNTRQIVRKHGPLDPKFRPFVRVLQQNLPISENPFSDLATAAKMTETDLISHANQLLADGTMRRFAAVLKHVTAGFTLNAMVCWAAAPDQIEQAGIELAKHDSVSHCYQRTTSQDWPWPLYTMIHCRTESELKTIISELAANSELTDYRVLRTLKEYKKSRVTYFESAN